MRIYKADALLVDFEGLASDDEIATLLAGKQASDADLTAIAALDSSTAGAIASDGAGWIKKTYAQLKTALTLVKGDVGLGNVDNTSDANKPVSTAQQTALNAKKNIADIWRRDWSLLGPPNTMSAGTWATAAYYAFGTGGASSTAYNEVWYFDIEPGTWSFDVTTLKSNNSGIITYEYSIDNGANWVTIAASVDMYNSALVGFLVTGATGIVISTQTRFWFRVRSAGTKNASSIGYYAILVALHARRTA